jgi:hypothetical protein
VYSREEGEVQEVQQAVLFRYASLLYYIIGWENLRIFLLHSRYTEVEYTFERRVGEIRFILPAVETYTFLTAFHANTA